MSTPEGPTRPAPKPPHWTALSLVIFIIGLLILVPSGLCTGVFGAGALYDLSYGSSGESMSILSEVLVVGGIPMVIGFVLVRVGMSLRKRG